MIGNKQVIDEKLLHTLEFKNFEKIKNITLDNFSELSLQEKKDFINAYGYWWRLNDCLIYCHDNHDDELGLKYNQVNFLCKCIELKK